MKVLMAAALALSLNTQAPKLDRGPIVEEWKRPPAISRYIIETKGLSLKDFSAKGSIFIHLSTIPKLKMLEELDLPNTDWIRIKDGYIFKNSRFFLLLTYEPQEDVFYLLIQDQKSEGVKIKLKMKEDVPGYAGLPLGRGKLAVMGKEGKTSVFVVEVNEEGIIVHTPEGDLKLKYYSSPQSF